MVDDSKETFPDTTRLLYTWVPSNCGRSQKAEQLKPDKIPAGWRASGQSFTLVKELFATVQLIPARRKKVSFLQMESHSVFQTWPMFKISWSKGRGVFVFFSVLSFFFDFVFRFYCCLLVCFDLFKKRKRTWSWLGSSMEGDIGGVGRDRRVK